MERAAVMFVGEGEAESWGTREEGWPGGEAALPGKAFCHCIGKNLSFKGTACPVLVDVERFKVNPPFLLVGGRAGVQVHQGNCKVVSWQPSQPYAN